MPRAGGDIDVSFVAHATKPTFMQQTFTIRPQTPYVFADATGPDPKVHENDVEPVSIAQERFRTTLTLAAITGSPLVLQALIDLSIQKVTATGKPKIIASTPVPPIETLVIVTIE